MIDGDLEEPSFLAFYTRQVSVAALAGWGQDRQVATALGLLTEMPDWPVGGLQQRMSRT